MMIAHNVAGGRRFCCNERSLESPGRSCHQQGPRRLSAQGWFWFYICEPWSKKDFFIRTRKYWWLTRTCSASVSSITRCSLPVFSSVLSPTWHPSTTSYSSSSSSSSAGLWRSVGHSHQRRGSGFGNIDVILIIVDGDGDDEMNKRETQSYLAKSVL